jgi:hypothetical protein
MIEIKLNCLFPYKGEQKEEPQIPIKLHILNKLRQLIKWSKTKISRYNVGAGERNSPNATESTLTKPTIKTRHVHEPISMVDTYMGPTVFNLLFNV